MRIFLPSIYGGIRIPAEPQPGFVLGDFEQRIIELMQAHPEQKRATIIVHPVLLNVARFKAADVAIRDYQSHTDPEGVGPNTLVRNAGYKLPGHYDKDLDGNNIESLMFGYADPDECWQGWLDSPSHRKHVLGEIPAYAEQICVGIGYYNDEATYYNNFWCLLSCPPQ